MKAFTKEQTHFIYKLIEKFENSDDHKHGGVLISELFENWCFQENPNDAEDKEWEYNQVADRAPTEYDN